MAINKVVSTTSLILEIESGVDSKGSTTYKKKSFSGVKANAPLDNVFAVANAISNVLVKSTNDIYLAETSILSTAE